MKTELEQVLDSGYKYGDISMNCSHKYIWPILRDIVIRQDLTDKRIFEIGCGNGATANMLSDLNFEVTGVDPSEQGVKVANKQFPHLHIFQGNAYEPLADKYGTFPIVISLEVVEHCFYPRKFAASFYELLSTGGVGIISTPYYGYFKNLLISLFGKWDTHFSSLWDGGHIKFFSENTLKILLSEAGFSDISFLRAGRVPPLAKSMLAVAKK